MFAVRFGYAYGDRIVMIIVFMYIDLPTSRLICHGRYIAYVRISLVTSLCSRLRDHLLYERLIRERTTTNHEAHP